ncbi:MAG: choice-of-anchor B domain-containing protein, partial [Marinoscillum sp.]
ELGGYYLNDIWGWTDPSNNKEYAIVGLKDGVAFIDISTPTNPKLIGKLNESEGSRNSRILHGKSTWRDIKVYKNHAFIVSDLNDNHGMQVFDLTKLRSENGDTPASFEHDFLYTEIGSAHNVVINESTGFAYIVGSRQACAGGLHVVDIRVPKSPKFIGCFSADGYTHDAQCVTYKGSDSRYMGKEICFNSNEDTFTIVDVEDKNNMAIVGRKTYDNVEYAHQGWLSEDHKYFLMNDELDEIRGGGKHARTLIWELSDLENPILIGEYFNNVTSVDHNLYTHQNLVFESNYQSGLRVLDMDKIAEGKLRERAYFDTYPDANNINYGGTWSNYPYFASGNILVSDMNNGLFILKLDLKEDPIVNHPQDQSECSTGGARFNIGVNGKALTYQWERFYNKAYGTLNDSPQIIGAKDSLLIVTPTDLSSDYVFRCKILDEDGNVFYTFPVQYEIESISESLIADFDISLDATNSSITLTNKTSESIAYEWYVNDSLASTEENPVIYLAENEDVSIDLMVYTSCAFAKTTKSASFVPLLVNNHSIFDVYPNPASDFITVNAGINSKIKVMDLSGRVLMTYRSDSALIRIDLEALNAGTYIISVQDLDHTETTRLIKR